MRRCCLFLICCLWMCHPVQSAEVFGELLYWKVTEPVDWVLNTNRAPANQFIDYESTNYDFAPGFRVGATFDDDWQPRLAWTHHQASTREFAAGDLTAAFLGGKNAQPPAPKIYFDTGSIDAAVNYDVIDLDLGQSWELSPALQIRPVIGIRGGIIRQSFTTAFQANYIDGLVVSERHVVEQAESNFWGLGPKLGIENHYALYRTDTSEFSLTAAFHAAYLLGRWNVPDVTRITQIDDGVTTTSTQTIRVDPRDFGSLTFQVVVGLNFRRGPWSGALGYEINDWLNQCQVFTDATGPQNNDLLLQGLNARLAWEF
jgi:hypothetical protein